MLVVFGPVHHLVSKDAHCAPAALGHDTPEHLIVGIAKLHLFLHDQPGNFAGQSEGSGLGAAEHSPPVASVRFRVGRGEEINQKAGAARPNTKMDEGKMISDARQDTNALWSVGLEVKTAPTPLSTQSTRSARTDARRLPSTPYSTAPFWPSSTVTACPRCRRWS
jgi:hypothetical protein